MSNDDQSEDDDAIHRVDTVPPPAGEGDAYSAATKVGPMAEAIVKEMMHAAGVKAAVLRARSDEKSATASEARAAEASRPAARSASAQSASARPTAPRPAGVRVDARAELVDGLKETDASVPLTYADDDEVPLTYADDDEEEDNAETMLSPAAKPPSLPHPPHVPRAQMQTLPLAPPLPLPAEVPVPTPPTYPSKPSYPSQPSAHGERAPTATAQPAGMRLVTHSEPPREPSVMPASKAPVMARMTLIVLAVCGTIFVVGLIMFLRSR